MAQFILSNASFKDPVPEYSARHDWFERIG
ncbi:hypothetical protein HY36_00055 [Hyphomonas atlantica]|uniref:Uncharacterized protein n=1 Tax=Hyphomonas atlantica TaxID=1280948 RepID=A0A059EAS7_9PROT|nr:hypothetical protein HY36_00055 [Hyphomonas atlantica]